MTTSALPSDHAGWLYDEQKKEYVQPASYEQRAMFEKNGFIPHPADRQLTNPRRLVIRPRPWLPRSNRDHAVSVA